MAKTKISEFSATPANNTDIDSINIAEGCAPSGINDAIRELMAQLKDFQTGAVGDSFNGPVGSSTAAAGAFTTLSASSTATLSGLTASTALALDASKNIVSVTNTGSGSNVLATSPTLVTPVLGVATGTSFQGIIGNVTPAAGNFTTLGASSTATLNTLASSGATLTGGTINGMTIGATTASTGAFTTLTTSSTVTHNGGTANGVTYLNGSKVLTSGSALTFDGSKLSLPTILAIKGAQNGNISKIAMTRTDSSYSINNETDLRFYGQTTDTESPANILHSMNTGGTFVWNNGSGSELMRLTSTGLGIGTSSPDIFGRGYTRNLGVTSSGSTSIAVNGTSGGYLDVGLNGTRYGQISSTTANEFSISAVGASTSLLFVTNSNERLRIDSAGNVGIGTSAPAYKLQVNGSSTGDLVQFTDGTYQSIRFGTSTTGFYYNNPNGGYQAWNISGSEKLRLDASGNLGLGVTPSAWSQGTAFEMYQKGYGLWNGSGNPSSIYMLANSYYNSGFKYATTGGYASSYYQYNGQHVWSTAPSGTAGNPITFTQAMTLDASGRLLVGTTSGSGATMFTVNQPAASTDAKTIVSVTTGTNAAFTAFVNTTVTTVGTENSSGGSLVSGSSAYSTVIANNGAYPISFGTNNTERARITSGGDLLVGCTSAGGGLNVKGITLFEQGSIAVERDGGVLGVFNRIGSDGQLMLFRRQANAVGSIDVSTVLTTYNTTSDYRLKTVVGAVTGQGARIDALEPIEYTWNSNGSRTRGFLAHKFQEVYADSVTGTKDAVDEEGKPVYQAMQAATAEVIADLVAEIQSLRQRLSAANL